MNELDKALATLRSADAGLDPASAEPASKLLDAIEKAKTAPGWNTRLVSKASPSLGRTLTRKDESMHVDLDGALELPPLTPQVLLHVALVSVGLL